MRKLYLSCFILIFRGWALFRLACFMSLVCVLGTQPGLAQSGGDPPKKRPRADSVPFCGTPSLPDDQRQALERQVQFALAIKKASGQANTGITYVPIRPHILQQTNGAGGMSLSSLNNVLARTNRFYLNNGSGIQFYFCGITPDYIQNTTLYNGFPRANESSVNGRDANNALNVYFINLFDESRLLGYAYFPENTLQSTRAFIRTGGLADRYISDYILNHELGHTFNLYHTFERTYGTELVTRSTGANCSTAGDFLCDTPADPLNLPGSASDFVNGCEVYTGTATDANGETYSPQTSNIMSYYEGCNVFFTGDQYARIQGGLATRQTATTYSLNCAPTVVAAPSGVSASPLATGGILLGWQDNGTNELGYIIERSPTADGLFVPIGGVAPNSTSYRDMSVSTNSAYWYRIRPSNSTTGGISAVVSATAGATYCQPTFSVGCTDEDGLNSFTLNGVTMSSNSGCSPTGVTSFPGPAPAVTAGQAVSVAGQFLGSTFFEGVKIWADLNRNAVFDSTEVVYATPQTVTSGFSGSLTIPASTSAGSLMLRVMVTYADIPTDPCGTYQYGEAEDYVISVTAPVCTTLISIKAGNWNDPTVWSCNRVPVAGDAVDIRHTVTVPANALVLGQKIQYSAGGKLVMTAGSRLQLAPRPPES